MASEVDEPRSLLREGVSAGDVISAADLDRLPLYLRRAFLHHLRLYQHWSIDTD